MLTAREIARKVREAEAERVALRQRAAMELARRLAALRHVEDVAAAREKRARARLADKVAAEQRRSAAVVAALREASARTVAAAHAEVDQARTDVAAALAEAMAVFTSAAEIAAVLDVGVQEAQGWARWGRAAARASSPRERAPGAEARQIQD